MNGKEGQDQKQNEVNLLDSIQRIIDRSDKEIDRAYRIYRILAGAVTTILVVGIALFTILSYKNVNEMKNDLNEQAQKIKAKNTQELDMIVTEVGNKVNKRIDEEFNKGNIQTLIKQNAEEYTKKNVHNLIEQKVDRAIKPFETSMRERNETLKKEVDSWSNRSKLIKLSDEAIDNGSSQCFKELLTKYKGTDLESAASAEVSRVKIAYASAHRIIIETLTATELDGSKKTNNDIKTSMLIKILKTDSSWESRVKAAQLLANRSQEGVPDALLESCRKDQHLEVVKVSLESFGTITGHRHDVLMCDDYEKWWSEHKSEIIKRFKPLEAK